VNQFNKIDNTAWNIATSNNPNTPWHTNCVAPRETLVLTVVTPLPAFTPGSTGQLRVTIAPAVPGQAPPVFASSTPLVCSVDSATGNINVPTTAQPNTLCTITVNAAGNGSSTNDAVQIAQAFVIQAANPNPNPSEATPVPTLNPWALLVMALTMMAAVGAGAGAGLRKR
jgi:hypothetical protein